MQVKQAICNEQGSGVVELAVIIVILIALALLFKTQIIGVLETIISRITDDISTI
jgi:hypothetical protein